MSTTAIKAVGEGRVGGYLVVWGSPQARDLHGEYFTPQTDLGLDWYECRPVLYQHGLDGAMKSALETEGPVLLDVRVTPNENCYPMIPAGAAARDMVG